MAAMALSACSAGSGPPAQRKTFALPVGAAAFSPDLRLTIAEPVLVRNAEDVQTRLADDPLVTESVTRAPFRALDLKLSAGSGPDRARLVESLRQDPVVAAVEDCPCVEQEPLLPGTQVGEFLYRQQRSCSSVRRPVPLWACLTELPTVTPPDEEVPAERRGRWYVYTFEAKATPTDDATVQEVKGRFTTGGPSVLDTRSPLTDVVVAPHQRFVPLNIGGLYRGTNYYEEKVEFPPGQVRIYFAYPSFHVSSIPDPSWTEAVNVKGAARLLVPFAETKLGVVQ